MHRGPLPDLDSLRCFVEAARLLQFRAAAKVVALTPAAFSQRIRQLEEQLDAQLFFRTTRRVELTDAGRALLPQAQRALEAAWGCHEAAQRSSAVAQDFTLGTRHELGMSWLIPALPMLERAAPGVVYHLYVGSGPDLEERVRSGQVDAAISSRRLEDPRLAGIRLHREEYVFVGSAELVARQPLQEAGDAAGHVLLDASAARPLWRYFADAMPDTEEPEFGRYRAMGTIAAMEALVRAGEGVAVLPEYLVRGDLRTGRMVRLLGHVEPRHDWFRLVHRADDPRMELLRTVAEVLQAEPLR